MIDRDTRRKLKRIWLVRSLVCLGMFVALGLSITQVQAVHTQTVMHREVQERVQKLELEPVLMRERGREPVPMQKLEQLIELECEREQKLEQLIELERERVQKLNQAWLILGLSLLGFITLLLLLLKPQNQKCLTLTGQLFFPEEYIAELEALHQRMKSQQRPLWFIQLRMFQEVVELLWAFYIHINVENLWLPGRHNEIDE